MVREAPGCNSSVAGPGIQVEPSEVQCNFGKIVTGRAATRAQSLSDKDEAPLPTESRWMSEMQ
eukprot:421374-Hanusia_phi.AAC.1